MDPKTTRRADPTARKPKVVAEAQPLRLASSRAETTAVMPRLADREGEPVLGRQLSGGALVVAGEGHDLGITLGRTVGDVLEGPQLGIAVGAPGTPVEQDHPEMAGQSVGQLQSGPVGWGDGEVGNFSPGCNNVI
ncbi:MAG TPA: hypothetical protein VGI44_16990 [Acidimicrobiales bacterium]